jgi:hypothetical protein
MRNGQFALRQKALSLGFAGQVESGVPRFAHFLQQFDLYGQYLLLFGVNAFC